MISDTAVSGVSTTDSTADKSRHVTGTQSRCHVYKQSAGTSGEDSIFLQGADRQVLLSLGNYSHSQIEFDYFGLHLRECPPYLP